MSSEDRIGPNDLREALATGDVLDTFDRLPEEAKRKFEGWVDKARDETAHWRRIDTLVIAMRSAPRLVVLDPQAPATETQDA